jgi:hypothetical protein
MSLVLTKFFLYIQFSRALFALAAYPPEYSKGPQDASNRSGGNPKEHVAELLNL